MNKSQIVEAKYFMFLKFVVQFEGGWAEQREVLGSRPSADQTWKVFWCRAQGTLEQGPEPPRAHIGHVIRLLWSREGLQLPAPPPKRKIS